MIAFISNTAVGYAVISGIVLLMVIGYTVYQLRKQVKKRKDEERQKGKN